jgi:hypothetical protein
MRILLMRVSLSMKKANTKLQLKTSTIRVLQNEELSVVGGGGNPRTPTATPTNCSTSLECGPHPPTTPTQTAN